MSTTATISNQAVWDALYAAGRGVLQYPNDVFVTLASRRLNPAIHRRVLDLGFGSGSNLIHLAREGFECSGAEVSPAALRIARTRLQEMGLVAELTLVIDRLPYADAAFDAVVAWQVLYYNDRAGLERALDEIHRVLVPGGKLLATFARVDDMLLEGARPVAPGTYVVGSANPLQEGAVLFVPRDRQEIEELFRGFCAVEIGYFEWHLGSCGSHWLVWAGKAAA